MKFSLFEPGSEQEDSVREILNFFFGVLAHPGRLFIVQWDHGRAYTWPDIHALLCVTDCSHHSRNAESSRRIIWNGHAPSGSPGCHHRPASKPQCDSLPIYRSVLTA
ncbi:unnamed protein product, partial [Mesorhabditis spiculigera]